LVPTASVRVGDVLVSPVTAVRDLGVYIDTDVTMSRRQRRSSVLFLHCARSRVCDVPCHSTLC